MANFCKSSELNHLLEAVISKAKKKLILVSPYIKLHDRLKDELKKRRNEDSLEIIILFGKNEDNPSKSISSEDLRFFTSFPNIKLCYEKNLHAKYYANDYFGLITSMNLHQYSQNSNIEIGVYYKHPGVINKIANTIKNNIISTDSDDIGEEVWNYFNEIIQNSEIIYHNQPEYETKLLGISRKYIRSTEKINRISEFFLNNNNTNYNNPLKNIDSIAKNNISNIDSTSEAINIYQMYLRKGCQLGFFIRRENWSNQIAKIVSISGIRNGQPLSGQSPFYNNPAVAAEFYKATTPQECCKANFIEIRDIGTPGSFGYILI